MRTGGWDSFKSDKYETYSITDPATNAATATTVIDAYGAVLITLTAASNAQTLQTPSNVTPGKLFTVINNDTSTGSIAVNGITIVAGKSQSWIWDGTAWSEIDLGITSLPVPYNQGGTGVAVTGVNYKLFVDASRVDTYTADGSYSRPFKTVLAALAVINADVGKNWVVQIASGAYSDNLTITGPRYLRFEGYGATLSGAILINSGVGSYDRIEFVGVDGFRSEKGPGLTVSGAITATRTNDSLIYVVFKGCLVSGAFEATTNGTWVLQYQNSRITGAITGTFGSNTQLDASILIESFGFNEFVGTVSGIVSFYNCHDSDFYCTINTTPWFENRFSHCTFAGSVSIIPQAAATSKVIYVDGVSYKQLKARTPTLTGTTYSHIDGGVMLGATTEILVGGGDGTNPVWTTATGSGSPVRATTPTLNAAIQKGPAIVTTFAGTVTATASTTVTFSSAADAILAGYDATNPVLGVTLISNALTRYIVSWTNSTTCVVDSSVTWAGTAITSVQYPIATFVNSSGVAVGWINAAGELIFVGYMGFSTGKRLFGLSGTELLFDRGNNFFTGFKLYTSSNGGLYIDSSGNLFTGDLTAAGTSAAKVLVMGSSTMPSSHPADIAHMGVKDIGGVATKSAWHMDDEAGNSDAVGYAVNPEYVKAASVSLTIEDCKGRLLNNYNQVADTIFTLPAAAANLAFDFIAGTTVAKYLRFTAGAGDATTLDGVKGADAGTVGVTSVAEGNAISFRTYQTGAAAWDWFAVTISGPWAVV